MEHVLINTDIIRDNQLINSLNKNINVIFEQYMESKVRTIDPGGLNKRFSSKVSSSAHQAHIAQSGPMTLIVQKGSSLGSCPTFPCP